MPERRVLVSGASGGLGRRLLPVLVATPGLAVRGLVHRRPISSAVEAVVADLGQPATLARALCGVDAVLHLAAVTHSHDPAEYFAVNAEGTRHLAAAAAAAGARRFVLVSSRAAVPGGGAYAESKIAAEEAVRGAGLDWLILRPAEAYGAGSTDAIAGLARWLRRWRCAPVVGADRARVAPVHLDDLTAAISRALDPRVPAGRVHTLAGDEEVTLRELVARLAAALGVRGAALPLPPGFARGLAALCRLVGSRLLVADQIPRLLCSKPVDNTSARRDLGFGPRRLDAGLEEWLRR